jgi:hypothetical protein
MHTPAPTHPSAPSPAASASASRSASPEVVEGPPAPPSDIGDDTPSPSDIDEADTPVPPFDIAGGEGARAPAAGAAAGAARGSRESGASGGEGSGGVGRGGGGVGEGGGGRDSGVGDGGSVAGGIGVCPWEGVVYTVRLRTAAAENEGVYDVSLDRLRPGWAWRQGRWVGKWGAASEAARIAVARSTEGDAAFARMGETWREGEIVEVMQVGVGLWGGGGGGEGCGRPLGWVGARGV